MPATGLGWASQDPMWVARAAAVSQTIWFGASRNASRSQAIPLDHIGQPQGQFLTQTPSGLQAQVSQRQGLGAQLGLPEGPRALTLTRERKKVQQAITRS